MLARFWLRDNLFNPAILNIVIKAEKQSVVVNRNVSTASRSLIKQTEMLISMTTNDR